MGGVPVEITINGRSYSGEVEPRQFARPLHPRERGADGHEGGVRHEPVRHVHGAVGRGVREGLHRAHRSGLRLLG